MEQILNQVLEYQHMANQSTELLAQLAVDMYAKGYIISEVADMVINMAKKQSDITHGMTTTMLDILKS